jgi:FkbH-like protein
MPEVTTVQLPGDPSQYAGLLRELGEFEKLFLTQEDRVKAEQYRQNAQRAYHQRKVSDITAFLEGLGTVVSIGKATDSHLARVHQLFIKTNQFNLTTKRYSLADIETFIVDDQWDLNIVDVRDNFGELGTVGIYLVRINQKTAIIDNLVLSCRAMGRGIETSIMNKIKQDYLNSDRCEVIEGQYIPTAKNKPVKTFYEEQGFAMMESLEDGSKRYRLGRAESNLLLCPGITVQQLGICQQ